MNQTILISQMIPTGGGTAFTFGFARGLVANGCEVYFVLSDLLERKEEWEREFGADRIFYVHTHTSKKNLIPRYLAFLTSGVRELRRRFGHIPFDMVIHTMYHSWNPMIERTLGIRRVIAVDHDPIPHSGVPYLRRVRYLRYYRKMPEVIVLSRLFLPVATEQYGHPADRVYYMPHGRMQQYVTGGAVEPMIQSPDTVNFLFFGYAVAYKGLHVLAEAYRKVAEKLPGVTLTVASAGDFSPYAEEFASLPRTTLYLRYIDGEEIPRFFSSPRLVAVLPYLDATQSGVIPIAMEYGGPVVATRTGGLLEQLHDGRIGVLCEAGDADSLADAMIRIATDPAEYARQSRLIRERLADLEWPKVTADLLAQLKPNGVKTDGSK